MLDIKYEPDWLYRELYDLATGPAQFKPAHIARIQDYIASEIQRGIDAYRKEQESQLHTTDGC